PDSTGYTADLLPKLAAKHAGANFTFIIGADSLVNSTWVRFDEVLQALEKFAIAPRPNVRADALQRVIDAVPNTLRERVTTLHMPEIASSSTTVRTLLTQGRSVRYLVPEPVWQYIVSQKLYGVPAAV